MSLELRGEKLTFAKQNQPGREITIRPAVTTTGEIVTDILALMPRGNSTKFFLQLYDSEENEVASIGYNKLGSGTRYLFLRGATNTNNIRRTLVAGELHVAPHESGAETGNILVSGNVEANDVIINSSQELKQDISNLTKEEAIKIIECLEPVKFAFKNDPSKKDNIGFIAEQVPDILSANDHKSVRYMEIISALTKVVKEQEKKIESMFEEISQLKKNLTCNS